MTFDAPLHLQCIFLENRRHVVDLAVARRAADAFGNMDAVIEIGKFRQIVNPFPLDRFVIAKTGADRLKIWAVGPDLAMAIHARLRRRHSRGRRSFDRLVAIAAIDTVIADMVLVAELDRLLLLKITTGQVRRSRYLGVCIKCRPRQHNRQNHTDPGDIICTFIEKLCHPQISRSR